MVTQEQLIEQLNYDPETGKFTWSSPKSKKMKAGQSAGSLDKYGYIEIGFNKVSYRAHRLAWLYVYGSLPSKNIDHINGVRDDNSIINLRLATQTENLYNKGKHSNNTSGFKGVSWDKRYKKWVARAKLGAKYVHIGYFKAAKEASEAYQSFAKLHHGEFYNSKEHE